jgi:hypothetical protein
VDPFSIATGADSGKGIFSVMGEGEFDIASSISLVLAAIPVFLVFGGIHCIGWSFNFPSHTERVFWRISSIAITGIPLAFTSVAAVGVLLDDYGVENALLTISFTLLGLLYILSRVSLLVVSFSTLRSLPASALQTVEWTSFLPHI